MPKKKKKSYEDKVLETLRKGSVGNPKRSATYNAVIKMQKKRKKVKDKTQSRSNVNYFSA